VGSCGAGGRVSCRPHVVDTTNTHERTQKARPAARRKRRFGQPESTAALRPSQRRAAVNRAARRKQGSAGYWLRRLTRS
jgi:hypothetical protein